MNYSKNVTVGVSLSLTGGYGIQGNSAHNGILAWAEHVNRQGGIFGGFTKKYPVRLIVYDDRSSPKILRRNLIKLIDEDQADIILGPYSTNLIKIAASLCDARGKLLWNHGGASRELYDSGYRLLVSGITSCDRYLEGLANVGQLQSTSNLKITVITNTTGEFSRSVGSSAIKSFVNKYGIENILVQQIPITSDDFSPLIKRFNLDLPDVIVFVGNYEQDVKFVTDLATLMGTPPQLVCVVGAGMNQFYDDVGAAGDLIIGPSQWEEYSNGNISYGPSIAEIKHFIKPDVRMDYVFMQAFCIGLIVEYCVNNCNSLNSQLLREYANTVNIETVLGSFRIDSITGDQVGHEINLVQWQKGRKVLLSPNGSNWEPFNS